jgi:septal ring factor EnvC (AmiA/AmiB activator)
VRRLIHTNRALALLIAGAVAGVSAPVAAENDPAAIEQQLHEIERDIEADSARAHRLEAAAGEQARQLDVLRAEMQAAARAVQAHEGAVTRLERERSALQDEMAEKRAALVVRRGELGATLAALQRIALRPSAALLVAPGDPNDVVRSGLLIRTVVPRIEARAEALRGDLAALAALDTELAENRRDLAAAGAGLVVERGRLSALVTEKDALLDATRVERAAAVARVDQLTEQSRNLTELLDALLRQYEMAKAEPQPRPGAPASEPAPAVVTPSVSGAEGRLTPPAHGEVVVAFGDHTEFGAASRGVTWRTRPGATIVAPWDGRVVFAGPFRHFGPILIIDHGEGYHSLIAGLGRTDARIGQWVLAGEPVGMTGEAPPTTGDRRGDNGGGGPSARPEQPAEGPTVYVEFRRNGQPINPLPWLAASLDRTDG